MGQFKPMVKMETTEPSVELKLAKGGSVKMKKGGKAEAGHKKMAMGGGAMSALAGTPALLGRPAVNAPVQVPGKPSMAMRRRAMMAKPAMPPSGPPMGVPTSSMPPMKKGGKAMKMAEGGKSDMEQDKAMIKKAFKQHDSQEHKGGKGTDLKLKKGGMKKYATGGVILGNGGGFKDGGAVYNKGIIPESVSAKGGEKYKNTMMHTAEYTGKSSGKTGDVKNGNGGGYATGGVILGNGGGFKKGGKASKKAYATGGTVNSGKPVAMPQGRKPVPSPVRISQLAGTYKRGGKVTSGESRLLKDNATENKSAMRAAKTDSNLKYGSPKRMNDGGAATQDLSKGAFDKTGKYNRELEEAMNPLSMVKELYGKARDAFRPSNPLNSAEQSAMQRMTESGAKPSGMDTQKFRDAMMKSGRSQRDIDSLMSGQGAVTETERSVTVSPVGKRRGGRAC